jgi:hypothetical protein
VPGKPRKEETLTATVGFDSMSEVSVVNSEYALWLRKVANVIYEVLERPVQVIGVGESKSTITHCVWLELRIEGNFYRIRALIGTLPDGVDVLLGWKDICGKALFPILQKLAWSAMGEDLDYSVIEEDEWEAEVLYHSLLANADELGNTLMDLMKMEFKEVFIETLAEAGADVTPLVIELKDRALPPKMQPRRAPEEVNKFIGETVTQWLKMGIIRQSTSAYASPVHVVKSATRDWRMCIDFRKLNETIKDQHYPLPNLKNVLERLKGNSWFAKLDLRKGYLQAPLNPDSIKYTAFVTHDNQYEFLRVPFGLKTAVSYYQRIMATEVLEGLIGFTCLNFLDDIIVYGTTRDELITRLKTVLERLQKRRLRVNEKKCLFGVQEIKFLGFIVNSEGLRLDPDKVQGLADLNMDNPDCVLTVKSFLGLANYFAEFIPDLSTIAYPLFNLTKKGVKFVWDTSCREAVEEIKKRALNAPLLMYPDFEKPLILRTDACQRGIGGVLFNVIDGKEKPIAFISKSLSRAAKKWSTKEQECFAIFYCVQALYFYLMGRPFCIETDHKNLVYMKTNTTNNRVTRWWMKLQEFDFVVLHIPGPTNVVADALSRCLVQVTNPEGEEVEMSEAEVEALLGRYHDALQGHSGITETVRRLSKSGYRWKNMRSDIIRFVHKCAVCQKMTVRPTQLEGRDHTVIDVYEPFEEVSIDTITSLPVDEDGYNSIIVCIDSFTRFVELFPTKDLSSKSAAKALLSMFGRYGPFRYIRSDRGQQYCSEIIEELLTTLNLGHTKTVGYRPQANGIVESSNKRIKKALRAILFENATIKSNWSLALPLVQRIMNASVHEATGAAPAELLFGDRLDLERGVTIPFSKSCKSIVLTEWGQEMRKVQDALWVASQKHLAKVSDKRIETRREGADPRRRTVFKLGDYVLRSDTRSTRGDGTRSTLDLPWLGPYVIVDRQRNILTLKDLNTMKTECVDIEEIKLFETTDESTVTDLADISAQDFDEVRVYDITDCREKESSKLVGKEKLGKKDFEFLVTFVDGTMEWLPYMSIRHCAKLDLYLEALPESMKKIKKLFLDC